MNGSDHRLVVLLRVRGPLMAWDDAKAEEPSELAAMPGSETPLTDAHQLKEHMAYDHLWSQFARELEIESERRKRFIFHLARKLQIVIGLNTSECDFLRSLGANVEMDSRNTEICQP